MAKKDGIISLEIRIITGAGSNIWKRKQGIFMHIKSEKKKRKGGEFCLVALFQSMPNAILHYWYQNHPK